ncbi:MAG TPA: Nudix family hydrolase, partial [Chromatiales bacterium]|nr:Nudix family hydrolase [Chromatiales bacterium]
FPGGKIESGETPEDALRRELAEELGIELVNARRLIRVPHDYADKSIILDVWKVDRYRGDAQGREGQPLAWVAIDDLSQYEFPTADAPVIRALDLPELLSITPRPGASTTEFLEQLRRTLESGVRLVQLRSLAMEDRRSFHLAQQSIELCHQYGARMVLNSAPEWVMKLGADGLHLSSKRLYATHERPVGADLLLSASCHSQAELRYAQSIGADFALLSPVQKTTTHPGVSALGWTKFQDTIEPIICPVYALGGMQPEDVSKAWSYGAQGIAGIRSLWG